MSQTDDTLPSAAERSPEGQEQIPAAAPLRMAAATRNRRRPFLILASLATIIAGLILLMADSAGFEYYKHVDEVLKEPQKWRDKRLQLHGFVVPGSIAKRLDRDRQTQEYKFRTENCGAIVEARFSGVVPDTFKDGAEVVLKGQFDGQTFHTREVMAKCPSKYAQSGEQQSQMVTRCARDKAQ
jgi:cytochrome c-type biogenesis protein CcmE